MSPCPVAGEPVTSIVQQSSSLGSCSTPTSSIMPTLCHDFVSSPDRWEGPGDRGSIRGRVIPKTKKTVIDAALRNKVRIKGKWSNTGNAVRLYLQLGVIAIKMGASRSPSTMVTDFIYIYIYIYIYIVIHRQTVSLYHNSSVWLDKKGRNPHKFTLDLISYHSPSTHGGARGVVGVPVV